MKYFLSFLLAGALFTACNKPSDVAEESYYVKYKLNGTLVTNTASNHIWVQPHVGNPAVTDFMLVSTTNDFKNTFGVTIQKTGTVDMGTYNFPPAGYTLIADYLQDQGTAGEKNFTVEDKAGAPPCQFEFKLEEVSPTYYKGSFTGNYFLQVTTGNTITITDGEFKVKRN